VLLDFARAISFFLTIFSLLALFDSAFFVIAATWQQRLLASIMRAALAACISLASGVLFRRSTHTDVPLSKTLPVRIFLWTLIGIMVLFALAWYLDVYYMPQGRVLTLYASENCSRFVARLKNRPAELRQLVSTGGCRHRICLPCCPLAGLNRDVRQLVRHFGQA
jgi:hypothetical protein